MKKSRAKSLFIVAMSAIVCFVVISYLAIPAMTERQVSDKRGLFSWSSAAVENGGSELLGFMKRHRFTELYQWFSGSMDETVISEFLRKSGDSGISVYLLTGDPAWATSPDAESAIAQVERTARINALSGGKFSGVIFDVEPHALDEWDSNSGNLMNNLTRGMKRTYQAVSMRGLEMIICIPNYYDSTDYESEMDTLIRAACDRVAVMNYSKSREVPMIEGEAGSARKYGKAMICIYEFQEPGTYGLRESETYFSEGVDAAMQSFAIVKERYPENDMIMAAHEYESLKRILEGADNG